MEITLKWVDKDGTRRSYSVDPKYIDEFYIGRLTKEDFYDARGRDIEVYGDGIYIFYREILRIHEFSITMRRRRHVLFKIIDESLYVIDHGPQGKGSTGGTYVNGKYISPGQQYKLASRDRISLAKELEIIVIFEPTIIPVGTPITVPKNIIHILENWKEKEPRYILKK